MSMRLVNFSILTLVLAFALVIAGCEEGPERSSRKPGTATPASAARQQGSGQAEPAQAADADKVVARSGDLVVTKGEVDAVMEAWEQSNKMMFGGKMPELTPERMAEERKKRMKDLLVSKLMIVKAKESGITATDEEVKESLEQIIKMYGGRERFLKATRNEGASEEDLLEQARERYLKEKYIQEEVYSKIPEPTEEEIRAWYDKKKDSMFTTPEMVRANTITIKLADDATEEDVAQARDRLAQIAGRIERGEDFEAVAKDVSEDRWAEKGGDTGFLRQHQARLGSEFDRVAFGLEKGKVSEPVRTSLGWTLIRVAEKQEPKKKTYEESKEQIKNLLPGFKKFEAGARFQAKMKQEIEVEYYE